MATAIVELLRQYAMERPDQRAYMLPVDGEVGEADLHYVHLDGTARALAALPRGMGAYAAPVLPLSPPGLDYIIAFHRY
jgi:hypothetical protein